MLSNQPFFLEGDPERVCLLLHGLGGGVYAMQPLGEYLHNQGWSVQAILFPGHDLPVKRMPASTWQQWYAAIELCYQNLASRYRTVAVVGHSTGATLGLHLAAAYPVTSLTLLAPFLAVHRPRFLLVSPERLMTSRIGRVFSELPREHLPIRDRAMRLAAEQAMFYRTFNLDSARSALDLIAQVRPEVPELRLPVLIIQSKRDSVVPPTEAEWLYQNINSQQKQLIWLYDSDHVLGLDLERETVFKEVTSFVNQHD
jgi:carboxylesterase